MQNAYHCDNSRDEVRLSDEVCFALLRCTEPLEYHTIWYAIRTLIKVASEFSFARSLMRLVSSTVEDPETPRPVWTLEAKTLKLGLAFSLDC